MMRAALAAALATQATAWQWWEARGRAGYVLVAYEESLNGGGLAFGQDLVRYAYNSVGFDAGRCLELCSGPGFIGFALLAAGVCDSLTLADVNPRALDAVRATVDHPANAWLRNRTTAYLSDGLAGVPASDMWDLVVSNPPHFSGLGRADGSL